MLIAMVLETGQGDVVYHISLGGFCIIRQNFNQATLTCNKPRKLVKFAVWVDLRIYGEREQALRSKSRCVLFCLLHSYQGPSDRG